MPFVKKLKSDAYFSRFQVKYRRRREGKTDCASPHRSFYITQSEVHSPRLRPQAAHHPSEEQIVRISATMQTFGLLILSSATPPSTAWSSASRTRRSSSRSSTHVCRVISSFALHGRRSSLDMASTTVLPTGLPVRQWYQ